MLLRMMMIVTSRSSIISDTRTGVMTLLMSSVVLHVLVKSPNEWGHFIRGSVTR